MYIVRGGERTGCIKNSINQISSCACNDIGHFVRYDNFLPIQLLAPHEYEWMQFFVFPPPL